MKYRYAILFIWLLCLGAGLARGQTFSCPSGTYDMLDWMTLDSSLRSSYHLTGSANPLYTEVWPDKFYWTKGGNGSPWDIQLYDANYIYLWITEYAWSNPQSYKKFTYNTNMPLAPRCAAPGYPGATITVPDTSYRIYTDCNTYTDHTLKKAVNEVWGPYQYPFSLGNRKAPTQATLVISYRYNCDDNYSNCSDKEEYYLVRRYGLVQWVHYTLVNGTYQQQNKSVFDTLVAGATQPYFPCF